MGGGAEQRAGHHAVEHRDRLLPGLALHQRRHGPVQGEVGIEAGRRPDRPAQRGQVVAGGVGQVGVDQGAVRRRGHRDLLQQSVELVLGESLQELTTAVRGVCLHRLVEVVLVGVAATGALVVAEIVVPRVDLLLRDAVLAVLVERVVLPRELPVVGVADRLVLAAVPDLVAHRVQQPGGRRAVPR